MKQTGSTSRKPKKNKEQPPPQKPWIGKSLTEKSPSSSGVVIPFSKLGETWDRMMEEAEKEVDQEMADEESEQAKK
jgi:hypothetical protein